MIICPYCDSDNVRTYGEYVICGECGHTSALKEQ